MQQKPGHDASAGEANDVDRSVYVAGAVVAVCLAGSLWLAGPRVAGLLASSAAVALPASLLAVGFGAPLGWVLGKTDAPGRGVTLALLVAGWLLPLHVVAASWLAAFGAGGWALAWLSAELQPGDGFLRGYSGAIVLHAVAAVPWAAILSLVAFRGVDRRHEEQSLLDASAARVTRRVTLRDAAPSLAAATLLVAALAATEIAVTDLLRVRTFAEEVYTQAAAGQLATGSSGLWRLAGGVTVLVVVGGVALGVLVSRMTSKATDDQGEPWRRRLGSRRAGYSIALTLTVVVLFGVPLASLILQAGALVEPTPTGVERSWSPSKALRAVASAPWQHRRELGVSLSLAAVVGATSTLFAAVAAWALRSRRATSIAVVLVAVALATPGPVWGFATIRLLNQPLDSWAWPLGELYGTWFAPWLAQSVRLTPIALLIAWPAMRRVPQDLVDAARSDGASRLARLFRVALPIAAPALLAAWLVVFAFSVGELSATALVVPPGTPPLSVRLLSLLHYGVEDRVAAICLVLKLGAVAIGAVVVRLMGRRF